MPDSANTEMKRLAWACRRGMLELDVLLQYFLKNEYADLSSADKARFSALLQQADPLLQRYFNGDEKSDDVAEQQLIERIRVCLGNPAV